MNWFLRLFGIYPRYVCGMCGTARENLRGECINGHDYWVELEDLHNPELFSYITNANLNGDALSKLLGE